MVVGGAQEILANVQILKSTHRSLNQAVFVFVGPRGGVSNYQPGGLQDLAIDVMYRINLIRPVNQVFFAISVCL